METTERAKKMAEEKPTQEPIPADAATTVEPTVSPGEPAPQATTEVAPAKVEESDEEKAEKERLEAAKTYLDLLEKDPNLKRATASALARADGSYPQGVDPAQFQAQPVMQPQIVPPVQPENVEPTPQNFMPPGQVYNDYEANNNPASPSAAARMSSSAKMMDWRIDQKFKAMQQNFQSEQQVANAQAARIQGVNQVIQNNNVDRATGDAFFQIIEALSQGKPVPGFNLYQTLFDGMYPDRAFNKRLEQHLASQGANGIPSTTLAPGVNLKQEKKEDEGWEDDVFGKTPRT